MHTFISCFLVLTVISLSLQQATTGYVTRTEYLVDLDCGAPMSAIRSMSFLVNKCNPVFGVIVKYTAGNSNPISLQYFSDANCTVASTNVETHPENTCETGMYTKTQYAYTTSTVPVTEGLVSYAVYSSTSTGCTGELVFFQQTYPVCYLNSYGDFRSERDSCSGTTGTTMRCYDTLCNNCTIVESTLPNTCDPNSHAINSCGAPTPVGGSGSTTNAKTGQPPTNSNDAEPASSSSSTSDGVSLAASLSLVGLAAVSYLF